MYISTDHTHTLVRDRGRALVRDRGTAVAVLARVLHARRYCDPTLENIRTGELPDRFFFFAFYPKRAMAQKKGGRRGGAVRETCTGAEAATSASSFVSPASF